VHDPPISDVNEPSRTIWTWTLYARKSYTPISCGSKRHLEGTFFWVRMTPHPMMCRLERLRIYLGCRRIATSYLFLWVSKTVPISLVFLYMGGCIYTVIEFKDPRLPALAAAVRVTLMGMPMWTSAQRVNPRLQSP
jgi:hypothetical protein